MNFFEINEAIETQLNASTSIKKIAYLAFHTYGKKRKFFKVNRQLMDFNDSAKYGASLSKMVRAVLTKIFSYWDVGEHKFSIEKVRFYHEYRFLLPLRNNWQYYNDECINTKVVTEADKLAFLLTYPDKNTDRMINAINTLIHESTVLRKFKKITARSFLVQFIRLEYTEVYDFELFFHEVEIMNDELKKLAASFSVEGQIKYRLNKLIRRLEIEAFNIKESRDNYIDEPIVTTTFPSEPEWRAMNMNINANTTTATGTIFTAIANR